MRAVSPTVMPQLTCHPLPSVTTRAACAGSLIHYAGPIDQDSQLVVAVCSPSRMSFLTGRRPTTTRTMNFMDHFRQADCGINLPNTAVKAGVRVVANETNGAHLGGSGQCCTSCTFNQQCSHWTLQNNRCLMYEATGNVTFGPASGAISGTRGTLKASANWTSLPQVVFPVTRCSMSQRCVSNDAGV